MSKLKGLFVAGTDTGVGKTLVTGAILQRLRQSKIDAVGFKPVVTGAYTMSPVGRWSDADLLHEACDKVEPIEKICPVRLEAAMAPVSAWKKSGSSIPLPSLQEQLGFVNALGAKHAAVVGEGIGGLLVPLSPEFLFIDLIKATGFPVVLVCRAGLGTINHSLLSLRELERQGIPVAGLIMSVTRSTHKSNFAPSQEEIEHFAKRKFDAVVPHLESEHDTGATLKSRIEKASQVLTEQWDVAKLFK